MKNIFVMKLLVRSFRGGGGDVSFCCILVKFGLVGVLRGRIVRVRTFRFCSSLECVGDNLL